MKHKGFTLVELAIVMTIIGLLIGGILKGQELLENARVTSTIAQVKSYDAAITAFRDIYDALPGDLPNAGDKIPGCNENCTPFSDDGTAGDGLIVSTSTCNDGVNGNVEIPPSDSEAEGWLMWVHLLKANLITGVNDSSITGSGSGVREFGVTDPASKLGGGFIPKSNICAYNNMVPGLGLALFSKFFMNFSDAATDAVAGDAVMIPSRAAQIDRKIDDGRPQTGTVRSIGNRLGYCDTADNEYAESISSKDCSLLIGLQQ